jgi:2,4-dienoyl-CoA reductase-like NADH-dependent reductase (Old Yellow Enzyme family)
MYLLRDVENFLKSRNFSAARFGREALRDPRFVFDLRNGREPRQMTVTRVRAFLEQGQ